MENAARKTSAGRMTKAQRREQLLDTALKIVRREGPDGLTLGSLAVHAGVSKPVAYEHFGTRDGLLIALYTALDRDHVAALRAALAQTGRNSDQTTDLLAETYIRCAADNGPAFYRIGDALSGSEAMETARQEIVSGYVQLFMRALQPHSGLPSAELERRCVGIIGAAEAISVMMLRGGCTEAQATSSLRALISGGYAGAGVS